MTDPRIVQYRDAALAMKNGRFSVEVPAGEDEIGQLGQALRELGQVLEKQHKQIKIFNEITCRINAGLTLDQVLDYAFESLHSLIPYDRIGFSLLEKDGQLIRARWARSNAPQIKIGAGYSAELSGSSLQKIIETRQPRILNDLEAYLREHPNSESTQLIVEEGMRSSLTCPLIAMGRPIGFIFFSSMQPNTYRDVYVEDYLQIADELALIVEKAHLYQQSLELNELKNKFVGIAAHDLRNPTSLIQSYIQLLLEGYLGEISPAQQEALSKMNKACKGMFALIDDLLDVSAIESGHLELRLRPVDLAAYLQENLTENAILAKSKSIELTADLSPDLPTVMIDPDRISQVLNNLISNAIKYSDPRTIITLRARATGSEVTIAVQDQGQGIPAEEMDRLFTEFGRTSARPTGDEKSIGLGLAIARRIVEAHGGRIWAESQVGIGSTFAFTLPLQVSVTSPFSLAP